MQGIEKSAGHQVLRPNHARWPNQEAAAHSSKAKPGQLSGDDQRSTEPIVELEIILHLCDDNSIKGVWRAGSDISHDVNENVFLDIPRSGIQRKFNTTQPAGEAVRCNWEDECKQLAYGVTDDEDSERNARSRLSEIEDVH